MRLFRHSNTSPVLHLRLACSFTVLLIGNDITLLVFFFKYIHVHIYRNLFFTGTDGLQMKIYGCHYGSLGSACPSWPRVHRAAIESQMKCKSTLAENASQVFLDPSQPGGNSGTAAPQMSRNQRHHLKQQAARMQLTPVEKLPQGAARLMDGGGRAIGFPRLAMDQGDKAVLVKIGTIS